MDKDDLLFVYGSLMRGLENCSRLTGAEFVMATDTATRYCLVIEGIYPQLVLWGRRAVEGELYRVSEKLLSELDRFENTPRDYRRERIVLSDQRTAWAYCCPALFLPRHRRKFFSWRKEISRLNHSSRASPGA